MPSLTKRGLPVLDGSGRLRAAGASADEPFQGRSLHELAHGRDPAAAAHEFPAGASDAPTGMSRRSFGQLLGASIALAGLADACGRPSDEKILPFSRQPDEIHPGIPLHYASSIALDGYATGVLVTANEGRPTNVQGNPQHPSSQGSLGVLEQAALLNLYDPNRARTLKQRTATGTAARAWSAFADDQRSRFLAQVKKDGGAGIRLLLKPTASPAIAKLRERILQAAPKAKVVTWAPVSDENALAGARLAFGRPLQQRTELAKADVLASFDADFAAAMPGTVPQQKAFAERRAEPGSMNRLYQVECQMSVTGMNADHRLRVRPSGVQRIAVALLGRLGARLPKLGRLAASAPRVSLEPQESKFVDALAADLLRVGAKGVVLAGFRQPPAVHAIACAINAALASEAVRYAEPHLDLSSTQELRELAAELKAGKVDTLYITAYNPAYTAPGELGMAEAIGAVPNAVYLAAYEDETAQKAAVLVPAAHELEAWGDGRAHDGTLTLQQPLIAPLFSGRSDLELLSVLLGEANRTGYQQLRDFWRTRPEASGQAFDALWEKWVQDGLLEKSATPATAAPELKAEAVMAELAKAAPAAEGLELNLVPDYKTWDGRFANNVWLQELPDPVTKLCWDNAALVSPATAQKNGWTDGQKLQLQLGDRSIEAPVMISFGHADESVTLALGYGRSGAEANAAEVGFDAGPLRRAASPWFAAGLTATAKGGHHKFAITQEHWSMEGRDPAVDLTLEEFKGEGGKKLEERQKPVPTMHEPVDYDHNPEWGGYKWGMAIDLGKCTGCNACVIACQSENNIPVVGRDNVAKSREMHWIRIDRYFTAKGTDQGDYSEPKVTVQPMLCQHCETAPCEYVCPVNATVHSDEGLNEMVYNRCIGTRYCSNNCPYKVRRFNFLAYTNDRTDTEKMVFNPDVTVRSRGVMEKCTFCVQRIERARIQTRVAGTGIGDGDVVTACQQACPSNAIVFGSLTLRESQVAKAHQSERRYGVLAELGTRPRIAYLARVRNPNPELA